MIFKDEYGRLYVEEKDFSDLCYITKEQKSEQKPDPEIPQKETYFCITMDVNSGVIKLLPGSLQEKCGVFPSDYEVVYRIWDTSEYYVNILLDNPANAISKGKKLIEDFISSQPVVLDLNFLKQRLLEVIGLLQLDYSEMISPDVLAKELRSIGKNLDRAVVDKKSVLETSCNCCKE